MRSLRRNTLHSSPFAWNPLCLSVFRGVKSVWALFTYSSPLCFDRFAFLLAPRSLVPRWRVVKSGWRVANNSSPLETPCLWAFQGIRWRVKSFWSFSPYLTPCESSVIHPQVGGKIENGVFSFHYVSRIWLLLLFFCTILYNCRKNLVFTSFYCTFVCE